jgi:exopolysaccharide biosynthesis polyprenyl glycosylphosphotransferase
MINKIRDYLVLMFYLGIDVLAFNIAVFFAYALPFYVNKGHWLVGRDMAAYDDMTTFLVLIPLILFFGSGINKKVWYRTTVEDFHQIFRTIFFADILLYLAIYKMRYIPAGVSSINDWPTSTFILIIPMACISLCAWRLLLRFCVEKELFATSRTHRLILVGLHAISDEVIQRISNNNNPSYLINTTFDEKGHRLKGVTGYDGFEQFQEVLESQVADEVLLASSGISQDELFKAVQACEKAGIEYHILPSYIDLLASKSRVDLINFVPMISYSEARIAGWNLFFKTLLDFAVSVIVLALFLPVWIIISLLIVFDSPGPPLFRQARVGRNGRKFKIFKFRTMVKDAQEKGALTQDNDERVTRVGKFLRRWSLDEVPQFINVLFGQMSVMGPRAVVPYVADKFDDWEKISLNVLPGITGLAQVHGRNKLSFYEKSFLSVYYIRNYSLLLDLKILLRTVGTVMTGVGSGGTIEDRRIISEEHNPEV